MTGAAPDGVWRVENTVSDSVVIGAVIQGETVHVTLPPKIVPAVGGLPRAAGVFTGRDSELDALLEMLDPEGPGGRPLVSAVAGMAGVGKTELVLQAAHGALRSGWFPGGALFVDLAGYDFDRRKSAADALGGWLTAMGVPGEYVPAGEDDRARLWRTIIEAYAAKDKRVLLVIDNAADTSQLVPLLPADEAMPVLVTSRHTLDLDARLHTLPVLGDAPSAALITDVISLRRGPGDARLHDPAHRDGLSKLARLCEGLPLALRIIAALLADRPNLTPVALAKSMFNEHGSLGDLDNLKRGETRSEVAVRTAFDLSYRHLSPAQARMFRLLPANPGPTIATIATAHLADVPSGEAEILLQDLHRAHLVEEPSPGRWRQHDLLLLHATTQTPGHPDEAATARKRLITHYLTTTKDAEARFDAPAVHEVESAFSDRSNALAWLDAEHLNLIAATMHAAATADHDTATRIVFGLTRYLHWRRRFNEAITLANLAISSARALGDRRREGMTLNNLGIALREVRRFTEAITACEQAAEIHRETGDRRKEGAALNNLGLALREVRRFPEAISVHEQAAEIFRESGDRRSEGEALNNLGLALWEVRRFPEAISVHEQAAEIFRESGDRHREGMALNNLGLALREVRRFDEAISAHEGDLEICRETGDRHREGTALNNLGIALREVRRFDEAISAHEQAAEIYRETGDRHGEGMALNNLGLALQEVQRFTEAISAHEGDLEICRETGDRHGEGQALDNLGAALQRARRFPEAIGAHEQAAEIYRETGDRHSEGIALSNLGVALWEVRRVAEARQCWEEALGAFTETGDDSSTATFKDLLASLDGREP